MPLPDYIDNHKDNTLENVLKLLIAEEHQNTLDIATGFFRIEAWIRLETELNQLTSLRLLIGRDPTIRAAESGVIDLVKFFRKDLQQYLEGQEFNQSYKNDIDRLIAYLQQDHIQVRLFGALAEKAPFLHAKAYIFDNYSIIGSSNFTPSGLEHNTELNNLNKIEAIARNLRDNWFTLRWEDPTVDKDYKTKLIEALNASKFGSKQYTPFQVFLKLLYEFFKDDSLISQGNLTSLELASFQQEGFERAIRLIEKHRGCIVADAVGLGKTYIGLRVIEHYLFKLRKPNTVPKVLVICPAQLRDLVWRKKLDEFGLKADIVSQEELSRDSFDLGRYRYHDLVVVDESHSFRNGATKRHVNLQKLLSSGKRSKRLLLLTATPINNGVFDLYHQISLITRKNDKYYQYYGIPNLKTFFQAFVQGKAEITNILMETVVRRSRQDVIRRQEAGEEIKINGVVIKFPKRQLEQFTYNFENNFNGLYAAIAYQIDQLFLAPYNIKSFKKRKQKTEENEVKLNEALVALQKALYLKRLESSIIAFKNSVRNQRDFQFYFFDILQTGKLLDSKNFRKLIQSMNDEDSEGKLSDIFDKLEEIDSKGYDIELLRHHIQADLDNLNYILDTIRKIEASVESGQDYDQKLIAFKQLLLSLKTQKILVFDYYKDTVNYVFDELNKDKDWLTQMGHPTIDIITGNTPGNQRAIKVKRFAPKANIDKDNPEELAEYQQNPIDILLCTDVLSEGQNLQDAGVLVNLSLHWNPVRMIQRAGRIDRLGTDYDILTIYNCFPEEGLETLLNLVKRLQKRIADIDSTVGLDASVLGEEISDRSLEELMRLKKAVTDAEKAEILEELEQSSELISVEEMRLPLLEFLQTMSKEYIEDIPLGIHSTRPFNIPHPHFKEGGLFLAFRAKDRHFWMMYPYVKDHISTDPTLIETDKRKLFNWLKCTESDYPNPDDLPPAPFNKAIFRILPSVVDQLAELFKKQQATQLIKPKLSKLLQNIHHALTENLILTEPTQLNLLQDTSVQLKLPTQPILDKAMVERVIKVITNENLRSYEKDLKEFWENYVTTKDLKQLAETLDDYFNEQELYQQLEAEIDERPLELINKEDIQLICYEWFEPTQVK